MNKDEADTKSNEDSTYFLNDDIECHIYGENYGYIRKTRMINMMGIVLDDIDIVVTNKGIYDNLFYQWIY